MITISTIPSLRFHPARCFYALGVDWISQNRESGSGFFQGEVKCVLAENRFANALWCAYHMPFLSFLPGPKASLATTPHIQQRAEHKKRWKTLQRLWCASAIFCKNLQNCLFCNLQCFRWGLRTGNLQQESRTLRATDTKWLQSLQSFTPDWETEGHPVCFPRFAWTSPCMSMWLLINEPKLLAFVWLVPLPNLSKARWQPLTPEAWSIAEKGGTICGRWYSHWFKLIRWLRHMKLVMSHRPDQRPDISFMAGSPESSRSLQQGGQIQRGLDSFALSNRTCAAFDWTCTKTE